MKNLASIAVLFLALLLGGLWPFTPAWGGAVANICSPLSNILNQATDCSQNAFFVQAAQNCLNRLQSSIKAAQANLSRAMAQDNAAATSAQDAKLKNSSANLANAQATLSQLETSAMHAQEELGLYAHNFVYAGPISKEAAKSLDLESYVQQFPCFMDNMAALGAISDKLDQQIQDLQKAGQAMGMINTKTVGFTGGLDSTNQMIKERAPAESATPALPSGQSDQGSSDVTGVVQDELKQ